MQQMIGALGLTDASPVIIPTWSEPNSRHSAKNFSLTSALIGAVYTLRRPSASAAKCAAVATRDLPEPVGVLRITWLPRTNSKIASSCAGYIARPSSAT